MTHQSDPLARAQQTAHEWLAVLATHLDTEDHHYVLRVLRAWLHLVRDRLAVDAAVHLGAQLPEVLRGVYYEGWIPQLAPIRFDAGQFVDAFAEQSNVPRDDVRRVVAAITAGLRELFSAGQLEHVSAMMPPDLRGELRLETPTPDPVAEQRMTERARLDRIEQRVATLTEAVSELVRGLEALPTSEPSEGRAARAARSAHQILRAQAAADA